MSFARYIGIDYSGAYTTNDYLKGLRAYLAEGAAIPVEVRPLSSPSMYWSRTRLAEWLVETLDGAEPTLVGIDHAFSFPIQYFETYDVAWDWPAFLDDFQRHWPTDDKWITVDSVRNRTPGNRSARTGNTRWRRLTDRRAKGAKSVFHFDVPGSVAKSTHTGLPWLRYIRQCLGEQVRFWPFDGWEPPAGRSVIAEVYPAVWSRGIPREDRTPDQHDAFCIATWLSETDRSGELNRFMMPAMSPDEARLAAIEGWILGIP